MRAFTAEIERFSPAPNFLIIDIEGGEYGLLRGVALEGFERWSARCIPSGSGGARLWVLARALRRKGFRHDRMLSSSRVWYWERRSVSA